MIKNFKIPVGNISIHGTVHYPDDRKNLPVMFIMHGFKGHKDWGFFPYLTKTLANAGAITVCFNFLYDGWNTDDHSFDVESFAKNTITQEIEDIDNVINNFTDGKLIDKSILNEIWNGEIYLLGFSLGGGIAILESLKNNRIKKLALWSSVANIDWYTERQKAEWRRIGVWEFTDTKTSIHYKMNVNFIDDIEQHKYEYDPLTAISKLRIPILILHGSQDMTVPKEQAISLLKASHPGDVQMELIETSGHTFGVEHPMRTPSPALGTAIKSTVLFFGMK
jgi:esterase/lipase